MRVSHAIAEIANIAPDTHQAYVGAAAFAHKAGLHASAIKVDPLLYNHVDPSVVGNDMRILVTEMAGRASIELKSRELGLDLAGHPEALSRVTDRVKELEAGGWSFEAADASFELLVRAELAGRAPPPAVRAGVVPGAGRAPRGRRGGLRGDRQGPGTRRAGDRHRRGQRPGQRPRRGAAGRRWPSTTRSCADFELADYKVRILEGSHGTGAVTRVLVETADGTGRDWTTVGVHPNVVEASWHALVDALTYGLDRARV